MLNYFASKLANKKEGKRVIIMQTEKKIAVFGDSISKGIIYENEKIKKLDDGVVNLIAADYGYEIHNYSQYGQSLKKFCEKGAVERFLSQIEGKSENYAVFCFGGNDADYNWRQVVTDPQFDHQANTPLPEFKMLLEEKVSELQDGGVKVVLTTIPPVDSQRYFDNVISKIVDGDKVLEFFNGDITNISRHQEAYNYAIIGVATAHGCPIIDLRTGFLLDRNYLKNYCVDGIHPNSHGHKFMAEQVVRSLAQQGINLQKRN